MLSCDCDYNGDYDEWWFQPQDFTMLNTKRGRRCWSCKEIIKPGSTCLEFERERIANTEIEERIWGNGPVSIASKYHCERCGEIFLNLSELGYCIYPQHDMESYLKEYQRMTGFDTNSTNA